LKKIVALFPYANGMGLYTGKIFKIFYAKVTLNVVHIFYKKIKQKYHFYILFQSFYKRLIYGSVHVIPSSASFFLKQYFPKTEYSNVCLSHGKSYLYG
tara:strand:- start:2366 stop:2659 length:294 start_codon:yes stop_codon:yes gene_type:complete